MCMWLIVVDLGLSFHFYSLLLPFFVVCHAVVGGMGSPAHHSIQPTAKGLCSVHIPPQEEKGGRGSGDEGWALSLFLLGRRREGLWRGREWALQQLAFLHVRKSIPGHKVAKTC